MQSTIARNKQRPSGAATANDVAAAAGVSIATVSRVLNNTGRTREAMRQRVLAAAELLGYVPHAAARALASQRSRIIGTVVPTIENPNFALAVETLQQRVMEHGYTLLLASSNYNPAQEERQVRSLAGQGVDAVVLVGGRHEPSMLSMLNAKQIPYVNTWVLDAEGPCVGFDNKAASQLLTRYLLDLGHTEFGVIAGVTRYNDRAEARVAGVRDALWPADWRFLARG
jgi:LacI family transcriptional regulator